MKSYQVFIGAILIAAVFRLFCENAAVQAHTGEDEANFAIDIEMLHSQRWPAFKSNIRSWMIVNLRDRKTIQHERSGFLAFLDSLDSWNIVVLGETTPARHGCQRCLTISSTSERFPNNQSKSMLQRVFILAIGQGASEIYVMTSLHDSAEAVGRMTSQDSHRGLIYEGDKPFNPCSHFAQPLLGINRTFGECADRNWIYSYKTGIFPSAYVSGMCEECGLTSDWLPGGRVHCDSASPAVLVQPGFLVQNFFRNALWRNGSLWALFNYLVTEETDPDEDELLKLSYFVQRLLWTVNGSVNFIRSHELKFRNENRYLDTTKEVSTPESLTDIHCDFSDSSMGSVSDRCKTLKKFCADYEDRPHMTQFVNYLKDWTCLYPQDIPACIRDLTREIHRLHFLPRLSGKLVSLADSFLSDIFTTAYKFPGDQDDSGYVLNEYISSKVHAVRFWPSPLYRIWTQHPFTRICSKVERQVMKHSNDSYSYKSTFVNITDHKNGKMRKQIPLQEKTTIPGVDYFLPPHYTNVVLVIVFKVNDAASQIQMAQYFDFIYGRHFKHIVYCTHGGDMVPLFAKMYPQPMNFVDVKASDARIFPYLCVSETMKMYHQVKGYLQVNSNALLNPWTIADLSHKLDLPWLTKFTRESTLDQKETVSPLGTTVKWKVWNDPTCGRLKLKAAVQDLISIYNSVKGYIDRKGVKFNVNSYKASYIRRYHRTVRQFLERTEMDVSPNSTIQYGSTVVFYVPRKFRDNFITLSDQFHRFNVHGDLVVPTMLNSFVNSDDVVRINGTSARTSYTSELLASYSPHEMFLFPWQLYMIGSTRRAKFMCQEYLPIAESSLLALSKGKP